jgi:hypothetical protein
VSEIGGDGRFRPGHLQGKKDSAALAGERGG